MIRIVAILGVLVFVSMAYAAQKNVCIVTCGPHANDPAKNVCIEHCGTQVSAPATSACSGAADLSDGCAVVWIGR